ncbi:MAG: hypothetical protein AB1609_16480 [Bacillota bacterium]
MTDAAQEVFEFADRTAEPGWGTDGRLRIVVRLLVKAAGARLCEGWDGVPEALIHLMAQDAELSGRLVRDPDLNVRGLTLMALSGVCRPWAVGLLAAAMLDPVPELRALAAESADRWYACHGGNGRVREVLAERLLALLDDPCEEVRLSVVGPVVRLGGQRGVARLVELYPSSDEVMRGEILGALASAGYNAVVARLARASCASEGAGPYLRRLFSRLVGEDGSASWQEGHDG